MITADKARKFLEKGRMLTKDNTLNSLNVTEEQWTVALWMIKSNKKYSHNIRKTIQPGNAGKTELSQRFSEVQSKWLNNRQHAACRVDELSCTQDNTTNPNAYKSPEDTPTHTHTHPLHACTRTKVDEATCQIKLLSKCVLWPTSPCGCGDVARRSPRS